MNIGGYKDMYESMPLELKQNCKSLALETENLAKWQESIENVIVNIDKFKEIAQNFKLWVEKQYDIDSHIDDKVDFYSTIIEQSLEKQINSIQNIIATI